MSRVLRRRHGILLADTVRMRAYADAIGRVVRRGDVVADLGCGLGALSFLAIEAGAIRVHAVEVDAKTAALARREIVARGLADRIHVHEGLVQTVRVPERVDVVVTETMGSLGFDENIVAVVRHARRRWLKPGGRIVPQSIALTLVPVETRVGRVREDGPLSRPMPRAAWLAAPVTAPAVALAAARADAVIVRPRFRIARDGRVTGFAGWFRVALAGRSGFSTGPEDPTTHWQQGFLPLRSPVPVRAGQRLDLIFGIAPDPTGWQSVIEFDFTVS